MTRFWLIRHGPTHAKALTGWTDVAADLSDTGALARLAAELPVGARVVSSDLRRAVATADAIAGGRVRLPHDARLREIHFGAWEGRLWADVDAGDPAARRFWDHPGAERAPGGESLDDLGLRVAAAMDDLATGGDVVVVAHMGVVLAALARARGVAGAAALAQGIAPLSLTEIAVGPAGWTVGRVDHLA